MSKDDDPLDLLEDDGDGVIETITLFDEDGQSQDHRAPKTGGCCVSLMLTGSTVAAIGCGSIKIMS